ncbi:hypothetical protein SDC9_199006 [bioreactor metagenome]|uniref:Uncharacterized protein n=1 Tax=bioreactor metagenome TaxID=1076179 RepID=A0A645IW00_9ZZZZ
MGHDRADRRVAWRTGVKGANNVAFGHDADRNPLGEDDDAGYLLVRHLSHSLLQSRIRRQGVDFEAHDRAQGRGRGDGHGRQRECVQETVP